MATLAPLDDRRLLLPIHEVSELTGVSVKLLKTEAVTRRIGRKWLVPRWWLDALIAPPEPDRQEVAS